MTISKHRKAVLILAAVICIAFVLSLTSCSPKEKTPEDLFEGHSGNFDTTANISYKDLSATARITRETPRSCSVTFSSPESLADVAFVFWDDRVDLNYKAMSFTFDPNSVPGAAVARLTAAAVNSALSGKGLAVQYADNALTLSGALDSGSFTLRLDQGDQRLLKLSIPDQQLDVEFINFTFLD